MDSEKRKFGENLSIPERWGVFAAMIATDDEKEFMRCYAILINCKSMYKGKKCFELSNTKHWWKGHYAKYNKGKTGR